MTAPITEADRAAFEREFHSRTLAYLPTFRDDGRPVVVAISPKAHVPAGHALAHSLINLLSRAHRHLVVVGDIDQPLLCESPFGATTLREATLGLARKINPFIDVDHRESAPADSVLSLGIGPADADLDLGADGWVATVGEGTSTTVGVSTSTMIGASLAACLGAYAAFSALTGSRHNVEGQWSAWEYGARGTAQGPALKDHIDVGRVLCVGAGAVANALVFFGRLAGLRGPWTFVDADTVDVSNLNRQLLFLASDAAHPTKGTPGRTKVDVLAERGPTESVVSPKWYGDDTQVAGSSYDVVLALANERGVRSQLAHRQPTVLLHATTSSNWQAQAHRHVAGHDDCLNCRLPNATVPAMRCSEGTVSNDVTGDVDAALPFLSGVAGLLLLVEIARLQLGQLLDRPHNFAALDIGDGGPVHQRMIHTCRQTCQTRLSPDVRRGLDASSRWVSLDDQTE
jgi:molybdopterin/thiamine biosynthesis adenylyltransferase